MLPTSLRNGFSEPGGLEFAAVLLAMTVVVIGIVKLGQRRRSARRTGSRAAGGKGRVPSDWSPSTDRDDENTNPYAGRNRPVVAVIGIVAAVVALVATVLGDGDEVPWLWIGLCVVMLVVGAVILRNHLRRRRL